MITNDFSNPLNRFLNSRTDARIGSPTEAYKKIKERQDAITGKNLDAGPVAAKKPEDHLSSEERRQRELKDILDRINNEESWRMPPAPKAEEPAPAALVGAGQAQGFDLSQYGFPEFLNDMPLFGQFKDDLVKAFKSLDGAVAGSINAQFQLNYTSLQMIANEAGGYSVTETQFSFKLDLNYVKAASGKGSNASISDLFGTDKKNPTANDLMSSLKDYFSPEKTAERILDFSTSFFPNSRFFKAGGDTEEARNEFADMMRAAIQKGFDQAMGQLGKVPPAVQESIDKTHELTFKGIDDFVKYGMSRNQPSKDDQFFQALQAFSMQMTQSYSQTTYTMNSAAQAATVADSAGIDAQA